MNRTFLPLLFVSLIYFAIMCSIESISASNAFGWLGFSIAAGSITYFMLFAPYGLRTHTKVFGKEQKYKHPVAEIPLKVVGGILVPVVLCLALSFGFYAYTV
ncbi:hypothetical protein [Halopseudomonas aestusnigri]|uniref:hypothetical protein n=1 Tax=Halopseudomonas aestusnigri TaxID=857252 RepID=UPI0030C71532